LKRKNKKVLIAIILSLICSLNFTYAFFTSQTTSSSKFNTKKYEISLSGSGGTFNSGDLIILNNKTTLPTPTKTGYTFKGYSNNENGSVNYSTNITNVNEINNKKIYAVWSVNQYSISYNLNGGTMSGQKTSYNIEDSFSLPTPTKTGHSFLGWTGTGLSSATKSVSISKATGNRSYVANWNKNYYTVNYYVNNSLWATRNVGYNDSIENLNAQSALDIYHTFHGWVGWIDKMPDHNIDLHANITESYCRLVTGHGPYGNASALLNVFKNAGWTGNIEEQPAFPGNYLVRTDYTLTRAQAEQQKNYIASHTNYNSYNYPYLYWVAVECTNGYAESWTRGMGQINFN